MAGKQAKVLSERDVARVLDWVARRRHPTRDRVMVLLSVRGGLRAGEIARLTWPMLLTANGRVGDAIELLDGAAKKGSGRCIPLHPQLRTALLALWREMADRTGPVLLSERGGPLTPASVVNWFTTAYRAVGLSGCSSHSGRRTFITHAARRLHRVGASLRDV